MGQEQSLTAASGRARGLCRSHTAASGCCLLSTFYSDSCIGFCPADPTQLNLTEIAVCLSSFAAQDAQGRKGKPACQGVVVRYQAAPCTGPLNCYFSTLNQYQKKHIKLLSVTPCIASRQCIALGCTENCPEAARSQLFTSAFFPSHSVENICLGKGEGIRKQVSKINAAHLVQPPKQGRNVIIHRFNKYSLQTKGTYCVHRSL